MTELKFPDFLELKGQDWDSEFKRIAGILFNNYKISANKQEYDIVDIEFYYDSPEPELHSDNFIYTKTIRNLTTGNWFFHLSGVDLTFGIGEKNIRGGILIRAIRKHHCRIDEKPYIIGSWRTMLELLNNFSPIQNQGILELQLVPKIRGEHIVPQSLVRKGIPRKVGFDRKYRFVADLNEIRNHITPSMFKQYYESQ